MKSVKITEFKDDLHPRSLKIAEEAILHVEINEMSYDVIISPSEIKEFIYGNLLSEGFIKNLNEVKSYIEKRKKDLITVRIYLKTFEPSFLRKNYNIVWTECGTVSEIQKRKGERLKKIECKYKLKAKDILSIQGKMRVRINELEKTGGVHFSALFDKNLRLKHFSFDVGRHNAVDKVLGKNLLDEGNFEDKVLFTTGRVSSDIVVKCLRTRIPVIISKNSPLYTAISLARKYNLCLIGYLRGKRFEIFSGEDIIVED
ncbi:MAG: formate dehydrogenase accessory sulfurtransferase FdhD [Thermoplasmata archaeon]|nr:MAG: formate dehydrogenase accessory sulfurtransferase FdhD [Thermoplasmata archaeon]